MAESAVSPEAEDCYMDHTNYMAPQDALHSLESNRSDRLHKGSEQCRCDARECRREMCGKVGIHLVSLHGTMQLPLDSVSFRYNVLCQK